MKKLILYAGLIAPMGLFAQARLVINGTAPVTIVENGGTVATPIYIEIANPASNAIVVTGTNGWIQSESEFNMVKWDISNTTGSYLIPFGYSAANYYLPLTLDIPTAGSAGGSMKFSTYHTPYLNSAKLPTGVTNIASAIATGSPNNNDNSYNAVDRFWILDATSYSTPPTPGPTGTGITFYYMRSGAETEVASPNVFAESNLLAQRFNPAVGKGWGDWIGMAGTDATTANTGSAYSGPLTAANFFRSWTLSNSLFPLPVQITAFTGVCDNGTALIQWTSATEINNDYYTLKKTQDNVHFVTVATNIPAVGNSSSPTSYKYIDNSPYPGVSYYMLYQTDYDGTTTQAGQTIQFDGCDGVNNVTTVTAYSAQSYIDVQITAMESGNFQISLVNMLGQTVLSENKSVALGYNEFMINDNVSAGIYLINVKNSQVNYTRKVVVGVR